MIIESRIRRKNGTKVKLDDVLYHFKPEKDERHLAEVKRDEHIRTFLAIPEGFQPAEGEKVSSKLQKQLDEDNALKGSIVHDAKYNFHGEEVSLDELVQIAFDDSGLSHEEWNELDDQKRYAFIDQAIASLKGDEKEPIEIVPENTPMTGEGQPLPDDGNATTETNLPLPESIEEAIDGPASLDREELAKQYKAKFGRNPAKTMTAERIKHVLDQEDE